MTDMDKLTSLLTEWGIEYSMAAHAGLWTLEVNRGDDYEFPNNNGDKVSGHEGFFTQYCFDYDGKFVNMGAWA